MHREFKFSFTLSSIIILIMAAAALAWGKHPFVTLAIATLGLVGVYGEQKKIKRLQLSVDGLFLLLAVGFAIYRHVLHSAGHLWLTFLMLALSLLLLGYHFLYHWQIKD